MDSTQRNYTLCAGDNNNIPCKAIADQFDCVPLGEKICLGRQKLIHRFGQMEDALNISKLQKQTFARRRSSVRQDAKEFSARQQPGGSTQNTWQSSRAAVKCAQCQKKFSLTLRKHHCRGCGSVFCDKCTSYRIVIGGALKRVSATPSHHLFPCDFP